MASLDHAMWFHRPCRADDWVLFDAMSPFAGGARGFTRAQISIASGGWSRRWRRKGWCGRSEKKSG